MFWIFTSTVRSKWSLEERERERRIRLNVLSSLSMKEKRAGALIFIFAKLSSIAFLLHLTACSYYIILFSPAFIGDGNHNFHDMYYTLLSETLEIRSMHFIYLLCLYVQIALVDYILLQFMQLSLRKFWH